MIYILPLPPSFLHSFQNHCRAGGRSHREGTQQRDGTIRRRSVCVGGARGRGDGAAGADGGREGCAKFFFLGCSNESISSTSSTVCRPQLGFWITRKLGLESGQVKDIMHLNFQMSRTITATVRLPLPNDYCYRTSTATERVPLTRLRHRLSPY